MFHSVTDAVYMYDGGYTKMVDIRTKNSAPQATSGSLPQLVNASVSASWDNYKQLQNQINVIC